MSEDTAERWAPIPEHPGYEASDLGRIRSVPRERVGTCGRVFHFKGRVLVLCPNHNGYLRVPLGHGVNKFVHCLVLQAFVGPRPEGMQCLHGNGKPADNRLTNLHWGTPSENSLDIVRHGTHAGATRTKCKRRHALFPPNLQAGNLRMGQRACLACGRARSQIAGAKRYGRPVPDVQTLSDLIYADIMRALPAA